MQTTSPDLVVLVGNPRPASRTRAVAEHLATLIEHSSTAVLDLAELTGVTYTGEAVAAGRPDETAVDQLRGCSILIAATPSYKGTYTGLLKLFFDRLPHRGLDGVLAIPVAVAASHAHAEATAADLARLLEELAARVPTHVALLETELEQPDLSDAVNVVIQALNTTAA